MMQSSVRLNDTWLEHLQPEFEKPHMLQLASFLRHEKAAGKQIFPAGEDIFAAMNAVPLPQVRVVILGQDPYHGPGQAHGLSFSVPPGVAIPPSLRNIYKELNGDLGCSIPSHGNLLAWARQGVLLLNSVLTVENGQAASHQGEGWEEFTDSIVSVLNHQCTNLVFLLWGNYAQKKGQQIDRQRHCVLQAPHPSPLSAHRGFLGCRHFSQANDYLLVHGQDSINWQLS